MFGIAGAKTIAASGLVLQRKVTATYRMSCFSFIPDFLSFLRVRLMWDLRADALRCWGLAMMLAVCSISLLDARNDQMPFQAEIVSPFPLVEADLLFLVLETSLYSPAGKSNQQQCLNRSLGRRVTHEVLYLVRG